MRLTYDSQHHVAYLYITDPIEPGASAKQELVHDDGLVLDFDATGRLLGIEFLNAEEQLRPDVLQKAGER